MRVPKDFFHLLDIPGWFGHCGRRAFAGLVEVLDGDADWVHFDDGCVFVNGEDLGLVF